jgi:hypothetical protein
MILLHFTDSAPILGSYRHESANPNMLLKLRIRCSLRKSDAAKRRIVMM